MVARRLLIVAYDTPLLRSATAELPAFIKTNARAWWHHLKNMWIIESEHDPNWWSERLQPYVEPESLIIMDVSINSAQGFLPERAWTWLNNKI